MNKIGKLIFGNQLNISEFIEKHAILLSFCLCLFCCSFSFMSEWAIHPGNLFFAIAFLTIVNALLMFYLCKFKGLNSKLSVVLFLGIEAVVWWWIVALHKSENRGVFVLVTCLIILAVSFAILLLLKKVTTKTIIFYVFLLGFLIRLFYVLITPIGTRQHDFYGFNIDGHGGYMRYLFVFDLKLPDFNPTSLDQFYHPPLHYLISAGWWKLLSFFGIEDSYAQESIQMLTLFYSFVCLILTYKTLKLYDVEGYVMIFALLIMAFHPTFIIFSGSVNNDILSVTFMFGALYKALKWSKTQKLTDILLCGLYIGCGMMTKLSAYMICLPIAVIFAVKFFQDIIYKQYPALKKKILSYCLFIVVCAPIALFWSIRNLVLYDVPINFVQRLSDDSWQFVGNHSVWERLFSFKPYQFASVYDDWTNRGPALYNEFNPMVSLLKTAMFGEFINDGAIEGLNSVAIPLFYCGLIIAVVGFASSVYVAVNAVKKKENVLMKVTLHVLYLSTLIFYYIFCFQYPHHCTMNIRYVSLLIVAGIFFIALMLKDLKEIRFKKVHKAIIISLGVVIGVFCVSSTGMFIFIS